ncbi:TlyA family RNA methyltransferase [Candidatus Saccharibacteria bacterium]|nr:TlyA family RNA methyltransferase [Candidatus Saccharibacteria bacterium]
METTSNERNKLVKLRLDQLLVARGLVMSRTQAQALIMAGEVSADGRILDKPGLMVDENLDFHLKTQPKYVSRAGDKLASVAEALKLDFASKIVLDVGSSTGGFTDYSLQNGAAKVYCVDVGTGQLAYKLRQDERAIVMEQTDIRVAKLPELADMAVMDVSFISLEKVLLPTAALIQPGAPIIAMAKPQFEAGKPLADKYRGVIPEGDERDEVLATLRSWMRQYFEIIDEHDSSVTGMEGNRERFFKLVAK